MTVGGDKGYPTFDDAVFETSFEKRRLRVLNSLLRTLDRLNVSVSIDGREARTPTRFAPTSQPFESAKPRSTILSVRRGFNSGRTGRSARRVESTLSCQAASEPFKTTIEARQRRLILGGASGLVR